MLGVVAVRIEAETTAEARFSGELSLGRRPDQGDEPAVSVVQVSEHLGERTAPLLRAHSSVEGVDTSVGHGVAWESAPPRE